MVAVVAAGGCFHSSWWGVCGSSSRGCYHSFGVVGGRWGLCVWGLLLLLGAAAAAAPLRLGHESREVPPRRPPGGGAWFADLGFRDRRGGAFHELLMVLFTNFCWGWGCCVRGYRGFAWWMLLVDGRWRFDAGVSWLRYHTGRRRIHGAHTPHSYGASLRIHGAHTHPSYRVAHRIHGAHTIALGAGHRRIRSRSRVRYLAGSQSGPQRTSGNAAVAAASASYPASPQLGPSSTPLRARIF